MYIVSACLAGFPCRYDGQKMPDPKVIALVKQGKAIPVCPEQLGGLTTPRLPAERQFTVNEPGKVLNIEGEDVTEQFYKGAHAVLEIAITYDIKDIILKQNSPSCGVGRTYDGSFTDKIIDGYGTTAELLIQNGLHVISEEDL